LYTHENAPYSTTDTVLKYQLIPPVIVASSSVVPSLPTVSPVLVSITLVNNGISPDKIRMPGKLSLSKNAKVIVGWAEDYSDPDSGVLAMVGVMAE
jgi:hypothetical protein